MAGGYCPLMRKLLPRAGQRDETTCLRQVDLPEISQADRHRPSCKDRKLYEKASMTYRVSTSDRVS